MVRPSFRFHDLRTEKLRALGLIGARRTLTRSAEALRRVRLASKRLVLEPEYRRSVRSRLRAQCTELRAPRWALIALAIALVGFVVALFNSSTAMSLTLAVLIAVSVLGLSLRRHGYEVSAKEGFDVAREFDGFFASRAHRLPIAMGETLKRLGEELSTLLSELSEGQQRGPLSNDDLRFVRSIVSEYLVNAVDPFLALRQPTAVHESLVSRQIEQLRREVRSLLDKMESERAQRLAQSATFLDRKLGS